MMRNLLAFDNAELFLQLYDYYLIYHNGVVIEKKKKKLLQHCKKSITLVVRLKHLEPSNFLFAIGLHKRNIRLKIASQSF